MVITCIKNVLDEQIPSLQRESICMKYKRVAQCEIEFVREISVNSDYIVMAISFFDGLIWYAIEDDVRNYPIFYPSILFRVKDKRLSKYWSLTLNEIDRPDTQVHLEGFYPLMTFNEWANDDAFYEKILDEYDEEMAIYEKYKKLIYEEALETAK